ncbi:MAG: FeoA domain-containing protein [Acidobacteria bacterium]|nr:FeoA domain-containing protein [Acidobacteriota bacterium]
MASTTVENYLKAIYQGQSALAEGQHVPMGQLATALSVVPGTATTMVKALAESGLVSYEPYVGVRLTSAGEKLAVMVLRRHRLVELFLVQVMGMNWTEVHDEAEHLEHVVSDRLIQRIDDMLGHPQVDPHGDPIPDASGALHLHEYHNLLTCPLNTRVTITRVLDQNPTFLKFIEESQLMPGRAIEVGSRDTAADSVSVRSSDRNITMGARAASKLLVQVMAALLLLIAPRPALAQSPSTAPPAPDRFAIVDNSFLIEEAFNQEPGIFQNIFSFIPRADWEFGFTQEWPLGGQRHQFSYTVPVARVDGHSGIGDVFLNYRYQLMTEAGGRAAISPRLSVIVPSGSTDRSLGSGVVGWQVNVPVSKQAGPVYFHGNAGFTHLPGVVGRFHTSALLPVNGVSLTSPHVGLSAIVNVRPMFNLMLETLAAFPEALVGPDVTERSKELTVNPGFRTGWNVGNAQVIVGLGLPVTVTGGKADVSVFTYFSYELPFKK